MEPDSLLRDAESFIARLKSPKDKTEGEPDIELFFDSTPLPPVGLSFGFAPDDSNVEKDEEGVEFQTYKDNRTFQADVISFIERYYYDTGELPTFKLLHETFHDYPECPRFIKNWSNVVEALEQKGFISVRGLPTYRTAENYLDPLFITAVGRILNPHDKRTDTAKLKEMKIATAKWNGWLKRRKYFEYYKARAEKIFDEELQTEAKRSLGDLVRNGDLSAIKYLDERTGVYRTASANNVEIIGVVIQAIMAILARTVPSDVINIIGAELRNEPAIRALMGSSEVIESQAS